MMQLKDLKAKFNTHKKKFRHFIEQMENASHEGIKPLAKQIEKEVWEEISCTQCANCCKVMTPTLTKKDRKRIADHIGISEKKFKEKYLEHNKEEKDWRMIQQPCVFLDLKTNHCTIYPVRPKDCAGFPHLTKTPIKTFVYIHKQNIEYCPATFRFVEKMMGQVEFKNI